MKPSLQAIEAAWTYIHSAEYHDRPKENVIAALAAAYVIDWSSVLRENERLKDENDKIAKEYREHEETFQKFEGDQDAIIRQLAEALKNVLGCAHPMKEQWDEGYAALEAAKPWLEEK